MSSHIHIPLGGRVPVKEILSDMPHAAKAMVRNGFSVVAKLPESAHSVLLQSVLKSAGQRGTTDEEQLAKTLNIPVEEATGAVAALALFSALTSTGDETSENVLQGMIDSGLIADSIKPAMQRLLPKITQLKPSVTKAVTRQRLIDAVLPSFEDFDAEMDIRIGGKEHAGLAVPVAVALLDTDARDQRLWFQLTREDVESLIEKLNELLKRFKEAEDLIGKLPPTAGGA
jgi:hypothetical protein